MEIDGLDSMILSLFFSCPDIVEYLLSSLLSFVWVSDDSGAPFYGSHPGRKGSHLAWVYFEFLSEITPAKRSR